MLRSFQQFFDQLGELRAFADRFSRAEGSGRGRVAQANVADLSKAQLLEYQVLLAKLIQYNRLYRNQLLNLKSSYQLMLGGIDDVGPLINTRPRPDD